MVFTIEKLYEVCYNSDIQTVREIVTSKEVDINELYYTGCTPLIHAIIRNHTEMVMYLLTQPELELGKRDNVGETALHWTLQY